MSRTKRTRLEPQAPLATFHDGRVVVQIADAGVLAILNTAAAHGLEGGAWDANALHPEVARVVAGAFATNAGLVAAQIMRTPRVRSEMRAALPLPEYTLAECDKVLSHTAFSRDTGKLACLAPSLEGYGKALAYFPAWIRKSVGMTRNMSTGKCWRIPGHFFEDVWTVLCCLI